VVVSLDASLKRFAGEIGKSMLEYVKGSMSTMSSQLIMGTELGAGIRLNKL